MGRKDEEIEKKLKNKEYLEVLQQKKYEVEIISRISKKHKGNMDELLNPKEVLDPRTEKDWIEKRKFPRKTYLEKFRKTEDYPKVSKELVKEKVEEYEKRKYYYQKIELNVPLIQSILKKEFVSELTDSKLFMDNEGNFYVLKKLPAGIATDEIEAELINKKICKTIDEGHKKIIKRVENLNFSNLNDLQNSSFFETLLGFYEKYPNADFLFNQFFSKQYDLFSQLLDKRIGMNEFSAELKKLIDIVYAKIEFKNDK